MPEQASSQTADALQATTVLMDLNAVRASKALTRWKWAIVVANNAKLGNTLAMQQQFRQLYASNVPIMHLLNLGARLSQIVCVWLDTLVYVEVNALDAYRGLFA